MKSVVAVCLSVLMIGCLSAAVLGSEDGLILHFTFDETLTSEEGIQPLMVPDGTVTYVDGKTGKALYVDKAPWPLQYDVTGILNTAEGTIEVWFKPDWTNRDSTEGTTALDDRGVFDWYVGSKRFINDLRLLMWRHFNTSVRSYKNENLHIGPSTFPWEAGNWYHITVTWSDEGGMHLYVNGKHETENLDFEAPVRMAGEPITLIIGSAQSMNAFAEGVLDEFKVYNYAKSADEIKATFEL